MSRIILVAMLLAVAVVGCNRFPDLTIQVTANLLPDESDCSFSADQDAVLARGLYDLTILQDYNITPKIESYIFDNALEFQASAGNIQIRSFDVTIKLPDGSIPQLAGDLPNPYQVTTSLVIPPIEAIGDVSAGAALVPVIPSSYNAALSALRADTGFDSIVIDARANGETSGGFSQQSPPFSWPVDFCDGCLGIPCTTDNADENTGCFPGQDGWTYCSSITAPPP